MGSIVFNTSIGTKDVKKNYLYKDVSMDIQALDNHNNDIKVSLDIEAIQNGIDNIFTFRQGERILLP